MAAIFVLQGTMATMAAVPDWTAGIEDCVEKDSNAETDHIMRREDGVAATFANVVDDDWGVENEEMTATRSNAMEAMISSVGDLWENWNANMDFPGDGTREAPYQIDSLSRLMGLSEAVAAGTDFAGKYLELTQDIDLRGLNINSGNWNPIGWYRNRTELGGPVMHPFRGHFDGGGNTISGLRIVNPALSLTNIGLFGVIEGGSVRDLTIEA